MSAEFFLGELLPWLITGGLALVILMSLLSLPKILVAFFKLPNLVRIIFLICLIGGIYLRFAWTPFTHRIYYDEDRYMTYTVSMAKYGKALSLFTATPNRLIEGFPDEAVRLTLPVTNSWIIRLFGYSEYKLFFAAKIINSLQIVLIFILAILLFKSYPVALFSAFGMAFLPNNIYWSTSITLDPYFVTFALLAMVVTCLYSLKPGIINGILVVSSIFCLLCVRIEAFLFLPVIALTAFLIRKDLKVKGSKFFQKMDIIFILIATFLIGLRALASISVLGKQWCCAENLPLEAFYPNYFLRNLLPNIYNLFDRVEFPFVITFTALISLIKIKNSKKIILVLWIISYFVIYSTYYAGMFYTFEFSGSYGRYFLILTPAMLMLAGLSIPFFLKQKKKIIITTLIIVLLTINPLLQNYKKLISESPYSNQVDEGPIAIHDFVENYMVPNTPKNSILINNLPAITVESGRSATFLSGLMSDKVTQKYIIGELKNKRKVYSTIPFNCLGNTKECDPMFKLFKFEPLNLKNKHRLGFQFAEVKLLESQ